MSENVLLFFVISIVLFQYVTFVKCGNRHPKNKCTNCTKRTFLFEEQDGNYCNGKEFCDTTKCVCAACDGQYFETWDGIVTDTHGDVNILIKSILKNYGFHYDEFVKHIFGIKEQLTNSDSSVKDVNEMFNAIDGIIMAISGRIDILQQNLYENKKKIAHFDSNLNVTNSNDNISQAIENLEKIIIVLKTVISKVNSDINLKNQVFELRSIFLDMSKLLSRSNKTFHNKNHPLDVSLSLENDLTHLEAILSNVERVSSGDRTDYKMRLENLNEDIAKLTKHIIELMVSLTDFVELMFAMEHLKTSASSMENEIRKIVVELSELIFKEQEVDDVLDENIHYINQTIENMLYLETITKTINEMNEFVQNFRLNIQISAKDTLEMDKLFRNELSKYRKTENDTGERYAILVKYKSLLDELLEEVEMQYLTLDEFEEHKNVEELEIEIDDLILKVEKYRVKFLEYCVKD